MKPLRTTDIRVLELVRVLGPCSLKTLTKRLTATPPGKPAFLAVLKATGWVLRHLAEKELVWMSEANEWDATELGRSYLEWMWQARRA